MKNKILMEAGKSALEQYNHGKPKKLRCRRGRRNPLFENCALIRRRYQLRVARQIPRFHLRFRANPRRFPLRQRLFIHLQFNRTLRNINCDSVALFHQRNQSARGGFRGKESCSPRATMTPFSIATSVCFHLPCSKTEPSLSSTRTFSPPVVSGYLCNYSRFSRRLQGVCGKFLSN